MLTEKRDAAWKACSKRISQHHPELMLDNETYEAIYYAFCLGLDAARSTSQQGAKKMSNLLQAAWDLRHKTQLEAKELFRVSRFLWESGRDLLSNRILTESSTLKAKADALMTEAEEIWKSAVVRAYGEMKMEWVWDGDHYDCLLDNGEFYMQNRLV